MRTLTGLIALMVVLALASGASATDGTWNVNANGNWSLATNWVSTIPDGAGSTANLTYNITTATRVVTIDTTPRTLGILNIGDLVTASNAFTLAASGGATLTFDNSGSNAQLNQVSTSNGDTITAPILLKSSLDIKNATTSKTLTLSTGGITSIASTGMQTITNLGTTAGAVTISAAIGDGATGGKIAVVQNSATSALTLSGANTFTGGVTLTTGTLKLGSTTALGATAGTFTITAGTLDSTVASLVLANNNAVNWNGNFTFTGTNALNLGTGAVTMNNNRQVTVSANVLTIGGAIGDGGSGFTLTKAGAGTLALSGANTYSGVTTVSAGTLRANDAAGLPTGSLLTLNGGVLETGADLARTGGSSAGNMQITGGASGFSAFGAPAQVAFGTIASPTPLTWGAAPFAPTTLVLNAATANNVMDFKNAIALGASARTVQVNANSAILSGNLTDSGGGLTKTGVGTLALSGANTYSGATTVSAGGLRTNIGAGLSPNSNLVLNGGVLEGSGATTFDLGLGTVGGKVQWAAAADGGFSANGGKLTVNVGGSVTPDTLVWGTTANFVASGKSLLFGSLTANNEVEFQNPIDLGGAARTVTVNPGTGGDFANLSGWLSNGNLTKAGTGTLVLTNTNTYTATAVSAGTLQVGNGAAAGTLGTGAVTVATAAKLAFNRSDAITVSNQITTTTTGAVVIAGTNVTLNNAANTFGQLLFTNAADTIFDVGAGTATLGNGTGAAITTVGNVTINSSGAGGAINLFNTGTLTNNMDVGPAAGKTLTINAVLAGLGGIDCYNTGTLVLAGANTFTGAITLQGTVLSVSSINSTGAGWVAASNMGAPTLVANGTIHLGSTTTTAGTLIYTGTGETTDRVLNLPGTTAGGTIDQSGPSGLLKFTSNLTATGGGSKTLTLRGSTGGTGEIAGIIVDNSASNKTSVTKTGTGTWTLSGANTYSGTTTVTLGTLKLGAPEVIPNGTGKGNVTVTGTLDLNTFSETVNGLSGAGTIDTLAGGTPMLTVGDNNQGATFSGALKNTAGTLALTKIGTGTQILSGTSSFSGGTTLNLGIIKVTSDAALGAVPASPTVNLTFTGGTMQNNDSTPSLDANRTLYLDTAGGGIRAGWIKSFTINGKITGPGSLHIVWDSGPVILTNTANDYAGDTLVGGAFNSNSGTASTLQLGAINALPYGSGKGNLVFDATTSTSNLLDLGGYNTRINGLTGGSVSSIDNKTAGGAPVLTVGDNDQTSTFGGVIKNTTGILGLTKIGAGTLTLSGANTHTGITLISAGTLNLGNNLALQNSVLDPSGAGTLAFSTGINTPTFGGLTGSADLTLASNVTALSLNPGSGVTNTYSGALGSVTAGMTLTKTGAGTQVLSGTNIYTGLTTVSAGTLLATTPGALPAYGTPAQVVVAANGTVAVQTGGTAGWSAGQIDTLRGAATWSDITAALGIDTTNGNFSYGSDITQAMGLTKMGANTLTLSGANTYTGATTLSAGILNLGVAENAGTSGPLGKQSATAAETILFGGGTLQYSTVNQNDYSGRFSIAANQKYNVDINGQNVDWAAALTSIGGTLMLNDTATGGTLTLSGTVANTYTGMTTLNAGELDLGKTADLGLNHGGAVGGDLTILGGTLKFLVSEQIINSALLSQSAGAFNLNGMTETITAYNKSGGTFRTGKGGHLIGLGSTVTYIGGIAVSPDIIDADATVEDGHVVLGSGEFLTALGAHDAGYGASPGAAGGILKVAAGGAGLEMTGAALTLNSDSTSAANLQLFGDVATLASSVTSTIANGVGDSPAVSGRIDLEGDVRTFTVAPGSVPSSGPDLSVSAVIANGSLIKAGLGRMVLTGANLYAGKTTIKQGILAISGSGSIALSPVIELKAGATLDVTGVTPSPWTLASGQTLKGSGTVAGDMAVGNGSTLSPGDSPGTLTHSPGDETWAGGGTYLWEVNTVDNSADLQPGTLQGKDPGFDFVSIAGALHITAAGDQKFVIDITGLDPATNQEGAVAGWNEDGTYSWVIATAAGGITGFDPAAFDLQTGKFVSNNDLGAGRSFVIRQQGDSIVLSAAPEPATMALLVLGGLGLLLGRKRK